MRVVLLEGFLNEEAGRRGYIQKAFSIWIYRDPKFEAAGCLYYSMPKNEPDIFWIVGHNTSVQTFLEQNGNDLHEKTIVVISCENRLPSLKQMSKWKRVFIPQQKEGLAELWKGKQFGFDFDLTLSELIFFNSRRKRSLEERLNLAFQRV